MIFDKLSFHESSIEELLLEKDSIVISFTDVSFFPKKLNGRIFIEGSPIMKVDGNLQGDVYKTYPDGEVINMEIFPNKIEVIVEWNDFKNHLCMTQKIIFMGDKIRWVPDS